MKKIARQPHAAAAKLDMVRASRIPNSRPLPTQPTMRPRLASGARCAANGIRIWATTEVRPMNTDATRKTPRFCADPAATSATAVTTSNADVSRRFSSRSPIGSSSTRPIA